MKKRIIIEGKKVHNVGYRPFLLAKAKRLRIPSYDAYNIVEDEKQQIIVSLEGEEKSVQDFIDFAKKNSPPKAKGSGVREAEPPEYVMPIDEYVHLLGVEQQNTVVQAGLGMLEKQDKMLEKQDKMLDKQDQTIDLQKQTVEKLDSFHQDTVQRFDNLRDDYGRISKDIALAVQGIEKVSNNIEKLLERSERDRKNFEKSMDKVANAILALAKSKTKA